MSDFPEKLVPRQFGGRQFGGRQEGAGRPKLPPGQQVVRRVVYLPPDLNGLLVDAVTDERGKVADEMIRILRLYFHTPQIIE